MRCKLRSKASKSSNKAGVSMFAMGSPKAAADQGLTAHAHVMRKNKSILAPDLYCFAQTVIKRQYSPEILKGLNPAYFLGPMNQA